MSVRVRNILEKIKYTEKNLDLDTTKPFSDNIETLKKELHIESNSNPAFSISLKNKDKIVINDFSKSLKSYGLTTEDVLNIEPQSLLNINTSTGVSIAYSGPIIIFLIFTFLKKEPLNFSQLIGLGLVIFHYTRRLFEINYFHDYGRQTISIFNPELIWQIFYYWVLFGICIGYFVFTDGKDNALFSTPVMVVLAVFMLLSEYGNYDAHYRLKVLKEAHQGKRGIPRGGLFEYVSSPHYFFELCSWLFFSLIVNAPTGYLFVVYSLFLMGTIAYKKHKYYRDYFKQEYPVSRKAMIPFIY
jgi:very-long-chain enoyl-CoA reductase